MTGTMMAKRIDLTKEKRCDITNEYCPKLASEVTAYADFVAGLAKKSEKGGGTDIISQGGAPLCCRSCEVYKLYGDNDKQR